MNQIERFSNSLGGGEILRTGEGYIFKLSSFDGNPVVKPEEIGLVWKDGEGLKKGAVFNPGAEIFGDGIILLPRCHKNYRKKKFYDKKMKMERYGMENYISEIWVLHSNDGENFTKLDNITIKGNGTYHKDFTYGIEDVRVVKRGETYFIVGCGKVKPPFGGGNADRIAIYTTDNFKTIIYHGIVKNFDSRNAFPFFLSEEIYFFLRFHPNIHLVKLPDVEPLLDPERNDRFWQKVYEEREKSLLLKAGELLHEKEKIGAGPQIVPSKKGWLFIYHCVGEIGKEITYLYGLPSKIERGYSICALLLDFENPRRILARTRFPLYIPSKPYELYGNEIFPVDIPCVVFPTGALKVKDKLLLYCGAGDKYIVLLSCDINLLSDYLLNHCKI